MLRQMFRSEPMKKKKRVDPIIEQNRQRRKARKIEKEIKRFTRMDRKLKPVEEIEGDRVLLKQLNERRRPPVDISENEEEYRATLWKQWARYNLRQSQTETYKFQTVMKAQQTALDLLCSTSMELYKAAIEPCPTTLTTDQNSSSGSIDTNQLPTLPIRISGPYATAPIIHSDPIESSKEYEAPDGESMDTTPVIRYEFELERHLLAEPKKKKMVIAKKAVAETNESS